VPEAEDRADVQRRYDTVVEFGLVKADVSPPLRG
jgi:hypothetical protein